MADPILSAAESIVAGRQRISDWFRSVPESAHAEIDADTAVVICRGLSGNVTVLRTSAGLVVCDTGAVDTCELVLREIRRWDPDSPVALVLFTHGHFDHVHGIDVIEQDARARGFEVPEVVAHENIVARTQRYMETAEYNRRINARQYSRENFQWPTRFRTPDTLVRGMYSKTVGDEPLKFIHGRGETDDHVWLWAPERKLIVAGDFYTWAAPNAGNPQKVQRYAGDWAAALRRMVALRPEFLVPGHGPPVFECATISTILNDAAAWLESLQEQTLRLLNKGARLDTIIHTVALPEALRDKPWIEQNYDEAEFVVRNIYRLYAGWWDGNPANLKPAPEAELARELATLAGGAARLAGRARQLADKGELRLAGHVAELAALAAPTDAEALAARATVNRLRSKHERSQMARGIFRAAANAAADALADLPSSPESGEQ